MWLVSHKLDHLTPQTSPRKSGSSNYRSSDDNSGGRSSSGSLTLTNPRNSPEKRCRNQEDDGSPFKDDASPSKMLRKAFFNAPTGNSLNIPKPTAPPMSPNPADVIGAFMQHHLAIHSPGQTPTPQAPHGVGLGVGLPPRNNNNATTNNIGATPTPMHTPDSPPQLYSLRPPPFNYNNGVSPIHTPESPQQLQALTPPLQGAPIPPGNLIPLGSIMSHGGGYIDGGTQQLESIVTNSAYNNNAAKSKDKNSSRPCVGGNNIGPPVISTGYPIFPSRVIETDYLDPSNLNNEEKDGIPSIDGGNLDSSEPLLGRGARSQLRKTKQAEQGTGTEVYRRKDSAPIRTSNVAPHLPSNINPQFPSYSTTPKPTAAALAAARAASAQHHVEALACTQLQPLPFRQDSGSSLDLARVFDYGDFSPGGGLSGFTALQRSPGGDGSADWAGGVDSITFSFGEDGGGVPHCGRVQNNDTATNMKNKSEKDGIDKEGGVNNKKKKKKISDESTNDSISNGKTMRHGSPPPEMLDVVTPEGEAAAEAAGNKMTVAAPAAAGHGGLLNNPLLSAAMKSKNEEDRGVEPTKNVREAAHKAVRFLAETAANELEKGSGSDGSDGKDGKKLRNELSSDSSNLGANEDRNGHKDIDQTNKNQYRGLYAEGSAVLDQREEADVQI